MRLGIATDHGGFGLKEELLAELRAGGHEVVDFGAHELNPLDADPDLVIPLAEAVALGRVERGIAICGSGVGAIGLRQQDSGHPRRIDSRSLFRSARSGRRPHEYHLHGWADGWAVRSLGPRPDLPGSSVQSRGAASSATRQSCFPGVTFCRKSAWLRRMT